MIRRIGVALTLAVSLALVAGEAQAGGSLPAANSGTISVYVPSDSSGAARLQPSYQGKVGFDTTGAGNLKNPRVWVACYQNGALVYGAGGSPSTILVLGGSMSQWVLNNGGAASCTAELYYITNAKGTGEWNGKGAQGSEVPLGWYHFDAAA